MNADKPSGGAAETGDYSATKAPENRKHVESKVPAAGPAQTPGGANAAPADVGMAGPNRDTVPSPAHDALDPELRPKIAPKT